MSNGSGDWDGLGGIDTVGKRLVPGFDLGCVKRLGSTMWSNKNNNERHQRKNRWIFRFRRITV
ncbi:hypothetical protein [Candidatus Coxiella mudrowiae]|uniref:hypothetical protein n=1 Tax=Candidatus Coxiella mudrowiae TaxID=2054173 RepID=UPI001F34F09F|nr:hypothetical protein [Candidatus Coxiella mudrowiae]